MSLIPAPRTIAIVAPSGYAADPAAFQRGLARLRALGAVSVRSLDGIQETLKFPLPKGLKPEAA